MSKQAGEIVALVAAAAATGIAVAMAIEATPGRGKFGRSRSKAVDVEPAENPRKRTTAPNRADMIAALGLEPEGKKRSQKYDFTTKEYWNKIRNGTSRADAAARRKLGLT